METAMLETADPIAFIPIRDADRARSFYETTLGLHFLSDDGFALNFQIGNQTGSIRLRVVRVGDFSAQIFTIFGWDVPDVEAAVAELTSRGVSFVHIQGMNQSPSGVWTVPGGTAKVAWFKDPDGNTLSVSQH
jgi:catechol 2,3-dioxygenase-like lactoylglutathione lyase family enzyme